jgi:uroporphyrinogen-III synthase
VAGEGNDGKLAARLADFSVRRDILYAVTPAEKMPAEILAWLGQGEVDAALFFSPRSAAIFRDLAMKERLDLKGVLAVAISPPAAAALAPLAFAGLRTAQRPNLDDFLNLLT